ncbi:hypothetical protein ATN83_1209 [Raoultella ornithinolytica]|nr:hypothetical protein ATN83_1209 [Raoultella ornithinolytica]
MKLRVPYRGAKTLSGIWTLTREYINASAKYWSGFRLKTWSLRGAAESLLLCTGMPNGLKEA